MAVYENLTSSSRFSSRSKLSILYNVLIIYALTPIKHNIQIRKKKKNERNKQATITTTQTRFQLGLKIRIYDELVLGLCCSDPYHKRSQGRTAGRGTRWIPIWCITLQETILGSRYEFEFFFVCITFVVTLKICLNHFDNLVSLKHSATNMQSWANLKDSVDKPMNWRCRGLKYWRRTGGGRISNCFVFLMTFSILLH